MAGRPLALVESELFSWMAGRLAPLQDVDAVILDLTWAIARLAPDLPLVENSNRIRYIVSKPLLQDDGVVVRILIRFLLRNAETVELLTIEALQDE